MALYKPSAQQLALACGASGAWVEVTDDLVTDTISGVWGRTSGFSDTRPGVFSFDLVNDGGKYTPGNASSTLATKIRVGMGVHHIVDGVHFGGTIRSTQPYFTGPASLSGSSKIRITCDDMLGNAARSEVGGPSAAITAALPYLWWPLDDPSGSGSARSAVDGRPALEAGLGILGTGTGTYSFGNAGVPGLGTSQLVVTDTAGESQMKNRFSIGNSGPVGYASSSDLGWWSIYVSPQSGAASGYVIVQYSGLPAGTGSRVLSFGMLSNAGTSTPYASNTTTPAFGSPLDMLSSHVYSVNVTAEVVGGTTTVYATPYVDGVAFAARFVIASWTGALPTATQATPAFVTLETISVDGAPRSIGYSNLTLTRSPTGLQAYTTDSTAATLLPALVATAPDIVLDTLPALSSAVLGRQASWDGSVLDAINSVVRTEQGYVWVETSGALLSPTSKVKLRERTRPASVDAAHTFSMAEILNAPQFTTDIENMVWAATASGPTAQQTAADSALVQYVGSASDSTDVLLRDPVDLLAWAQDRLLRGKATDVRLPQFTVDALQINRWSDVSTFRAGDRIRVNVPLAQLGVSYIDGWLVGCNYSLQYPSVDRQDDAMLFTFAFQPVLPTGGIYDTSVYDTAIYAF